MFLCDVNPGYFFKSQPVFLSLILLLILSTSITCQQHRPKDYSQQNEEVENISGPGHDKTEFDIFGIDSRLDRTTHTIRRNESLSYILGKYGIEASVAHQVDLASRPVFNFRRIRPGRSLHLYSTRYPDQTALEKGSTITDAVYEINAREYIHIVFSDSLHVLQGSKPVQTQIQIAEGTIQQSLYQTLIDIGASPQLTHRLADIFAWQIDFYRIQPGDYFKILYEENLIDEQITETGRIKAAHFRHRNEDFFAFHFRQNDLDEYFDEKGNSLRRQFMAAPIDYTRISSRFSHSRYHPVLRRHMPHYGIDYAAPTGTPIRAVGDGEILQAHFDRNNGNFVRIRYNSIYETGYLHMSRFAEGITPGVHVQQGQIIGYVGSTGLATGPHVCFRFWKHGRPVNPQQIDLPPADPIQNEYRLAYHDIKQKWLTELGIDPSTVIPLQTFTMGIGYSGVLSNQDLSQPSVRIPYYR